MATDPAPWCGTSLPDDRDGWYVRAMAFKESAEEAEAEAERYKDALARARLWIEGAAETFAGSMDCGEEEPLNPGECVNGDSFCERTRDMNRALAEIDAALGESQT